MFVRLAVVTLIRRTEIEALYRRPSTSKPAPGHKIYPYLLRGLVIDRPNQVWPMDITHIPMAHGFVYLAAVVGWASRRVLAWRLSITLATQFCLDAVNGALARHGEPEILNTDQGSQFTSAAFMGLLQEPAIASGMDGRGAWRDNVFVERLWRTVKYEAVHLRADGGVSDARASPGRCQDFYNARRPPSSPGGGRWSRPISPICRSRWQHEEAPQLRCCSGRASPSLRDTSGSSIPADGTQHGLPAQPLRSPGILRPP